MGKDKLEDIFDDNTKVLLCGMAAGKKSCEMNHYYADKGNRFWKVLASAYSINNFVEPNDDKIKEHNYGLLRKNGIGLTDLVKDQCGMDKKVKVTEKDIERLKILIKNRKKIKALIFNGKKPASIFLKINKRRLNFGKQKEKSKELGINIYVLPSTSGINTKYNAEELVKMLKSFIK